MYFHQPHLPVLLLDGQALYLDGEAVEVGKVDVLEEELVVLVGDVVAVLLAVVAVVDLDLVGDGEGGVQLDVGGV